MFKHCYSNTAAAALAAAAAVSTLAGPLDKSKISGDAKWVVHLDVEAFRNSRFGSHFLKEVVEPKLRDAEQAKKLNLSLSISNISSITAYGPSFEETGEGVLMVATTADVKKDLDTAAGMFMLAGATNTQLQTIQKEPYLLYTFNSNVFIAPNLQQHLVIAKSRAQLDEARKVLSGGGASLAKSSHFSGYPDTPNSYFFLGVAEGFANTGSMPPQAQVLREARGGRLAVGERESNLFVDLVFRGRDQEASTRIQQVLQGVVALISLSQEDQQLTRIANETKIGCEGENVLVNVRFPVEMAIKHLDDELRDEAPPHRKHGKHSKPAKKKVVKESEENEPQDQPDSK